MRRSLQRRLSECLDEYKRILKWLRIHGREQEADEADVKLREVRILQNNLFSIDISN